MRSVAAGTAILAAAVLAISVASPALADPDTCGTIEAEMPVEEVVLISEDCDLTGVVATSEVTNLGAEVPDPGMSVAVNALSANGESELTVDVDPDGTVHVDERVNEFDATPQPAGPVSQEAVGGVAACSDETYQNLYGKDSDQRQWYYNPVRVPGGQGTSAANYFLQGIRSSIANLTSGYNDCGLNGSFRASSLYRGTSTAVGSVTQAGTCAGRDSVNLVEWGPLDGDPGPLAVACTWSSSGEIFEGDIKIDNGFSYLTGAVPSNCTYSFDVMAIMTHEWAHTFGLGHAPGNTPDHRQQTMSPLITPCSTFQRTLGRGDWFGMFRTYGLR